MSRGEVRPVVIASKILTRLVKFPFAVVSGGQPPELSEKKVLLLEQRLRRLRTGSLRQAKEYLLGDRLESGIQVSRLGSK